MTEATEKRAPFSDIQSNQCFSGSTGVATQTILVLRRWVRPLVSDYHGPDLYQDVCRLNTHCGLEIAENEQLLAEVHIGKITADSSEEFFLNYKPD